MIVEKTCDQIYYVRIMNDDHDYYVIVNILCDNFGKTTRDPYKFSSFEPPIRLILIRLQEQGYAIFVQELSS